MCHRAALTIWTLLLFPLLVFGAPPTALQPAPTPPAPSLPASISGTVTDVEHAAIASASVTLSGPDASDHAATSTDTQGSFLFQNLRPAIPYRITIAAPGFAPWTSPALTLQTGEQRILSDIVLKIAVVQTTVTAVTLDQLATSQVHQQEKQRVLGVFPNFYVTYSPHPAPLTTKLKFQLALRSLIDPVNILGIAAFAGFNQAADTPDFPQNIQGYAQRFGAGYADGVTDIMIGGAILPSLLHQDPRYFYQGTGTVKSRLLHAIAFSVLSKGDDGHWQPNYSSIGGDLASGALSTLYYPPSNRGASLVFTNALLGAAGRAADDFAQEFVFKKFTTHSQHPNP